MELEEGHQESPGPPHGITASSRESSFSVTLTEARALTLLSSHRAHILL